MTYTHADFDRDYPFAAKYESELEEGRKRQYERKHGSLDGYKPSRDFPCTGQMRATAQIRLLSVMECERCGFVASTGELGKDKVKES